jgi:hypothetical protein
VIKVLLVLGVVFLAVGVIAWGSQGFPPFHHFTD